METLGSIIGLVGVSLVVVAYFLNQMGKMASDELLFPVLNIAGSALILVSLIWQWNLPSCIMQCVWIAVSLVGVVRILKAKRAKV